MTMTDASKHASKPKRSARAVLLLKLSCLAALLALFTACSSTPAPAIETEAQSVVQDFLMSKSANRSGSSVLDTSAVAGRVYVFTAQATGVKQVEFYIDDVKRSGTPYQIEKLGPFDLSGGGTSSANALDTSKLSDGIHTVTARVRYTSGSEKISTATFLVDNGGKLGNSLLVSSAPDRSGAKLLADSKVNGKVHVFVVPTMSIKQVSFYLDNASRSGKPNQTERIGFYDFAGTASTGDADAFDTSKLKDGKHTMTAAILTSSGKTQVVSASFTVGASASASAPTPTAPKGTYALRGNLKFSSSQLTTEQRKWYDALWTVIKNPDQYPNATALAKSDNAYLYRGDLQDYINSLLTAFRLTGDLKLLDEVDRIGQLMRGNLADGWRGTLDGKDGTKDGFLNWVDRYDTSTAFRGKDTQMAYDLKANALVAQIAWALQNNRDLKSPSGVNYGAHADFWKDYLVNDFEAKWRKRKGVPSGFPFVRENGFHTYHSFMKWHYYMGKLTGNSAYSKEAERMADVLWKSEFKETPSNYGTALVWPRGVQAISTDSKQNYMEPTTYAPTVLQEAVDLHFEGFNGYAKDSNMQKFANMVANFVTDDNSFNSFARDIGGGKSRAGIAASSSSWSRKSAPNFAESAWSYLAAWDVNAAGRIGNAATTVYGNVEMVKYKRDPKRVFIPTAMFVKEMLK